MLLRRDWRTSEEPQCEQEKPSLLLTIFLVGTIPEFEMGDNN
jgi:hypothetical protein